MDVTNISVGYVILNFIRITANYAVIDFTIMTVNGVAYLQINFKGFKTEVASDWLIDLAQDALPI